MMLGGAGSSQKNDPAARQIAAIKQKLEESWGHHEKFKEELQRQASDDNYEEDEFEKHDDFEIEEKAYKKEVGYDDEEEKIVDDEFNLNSSGGSSSGSMGKKDSDFLKELMKAPIRTKFSSQSKPVTQASTDGDGSEDEIDEFIKKHIENEEKASETDAKKAVKRF